MTAGEDEAQPIVSHRVVLRFPLALLERLQRRQLVDFFGEAGATPQAIDRLVPSRLNEPSAGIVRQLSRRPLLESGGERFLNHLLGEVEIAEEADQSGEDASRFRAIEPADGVGDRRWSYIDNTGLTSIEPTRALGTRAAMAHASSRSFASIR